MELLGFPDWKKIGKKLRDVLNPPTETGPSKEEQRAQRFRDNLKGFVYFDDLDQVLAWHLRNIDPIQVANTPLIERSAGHVHDQTGSTTSVLLCHDYSGGYHEYEGVRPLPVDNKLYSCNYLQHVDIFVYFSHKLVCIPPRTWMNTMHRNGVKILGTFIIESDKLQLERLFERLNDEFALARQLADMAELYGFDGWLLNFEAKLPKSMDVFQLEAFIECLKRLLGPKRQVVWYDALTVSDEVDYQNGLTGKNLPFALAADSLFTNYKWNEKKLGESRKRAETSGLEFLKVYFGVDVWAQNTNMFGPPRVTFPPAGGGGTNTGLALSVLANWGFSAAIFGPAWTHEHFSTSSTSGVSDAKSVEISMWEGLSLPSGVTCDCRIRRPHHTLEYMMNPIIKSAREYPAGSISFFETDFHGVFEPEAGAGEQVHNWHSKLGSQSVLPNLSSLPWPEIVYLISHGPSTRIIYGGLPDKRSKGLLITTDVRGHGQSKIQPKEQCRLCLFKLNMPADGTLQCNVKIGRILPSQGTWGLYTAFSHSSSKGLNYVYWSDRKFGGLDTLPIPLHFDNAHSRLVELGVYCESIGIDNVATLELCRILNIAIKPKISGRVFWIINNVHVKQREHSTGGERRLAWEWIGSIDSRSTGLPWSETTGPFSHFLIFAGGRKFGRAYCNEFPLQESDFQDCDQDCEQERQGGVVEVVIEGVLFGGGRVKSGPVPISGSKRMVP